MKTQEQKDALREAIRNGGFYGTNGVWNSIITKAGDSHIYRGRVETIIVRDKKEVFLKKKPDGSYFLPGGSFEKDVPNIDQAARECLEEAHIIVENVESTGITYDKYIETPNWVKKEGLIEWNAMHTELYTAEYKAPYHGFIDKVDRDPFILSGRFYPVKECMKFFEKYHREALFYYLKTRLGSEDMVIETKIEKSPAGNEARNMVRSSIHILDKKNCITMSTDDKIPGKPFGMPICSASIWKFIGRHSAYTQKEMNEYQSYIKNIYSTASRILDKKGIKTDYSKVDEDRWFLFAKITKEDEDVFEESYMTNYFKNSRLLRKIGNGRPELSREALKEIDLALTKCYRDKRNSKEVLAAEKKGNVDELIFSCLIMTFDADKKQIHFGVCFDEKEYTPACATRTAGKDFVVVYPKYFESNTSLDDKCFTLLHEIGHIRLSHLDNKNGILSMGGLTPGFDVMKYRAALAKRGRCMYPEINADLYAVLNGASLYSIMSMAEMKDYADGYDYTVTNNEVARRYLEVNKKFNRIKRG